MRNRAVLLPSTDADLFARVLLEAEFFGADWLVQEVKAKVMMNCLSAEVYHIGVRAVMPDAFAWQLDNAQVQLRACQTPCNSDDRDERLKGHALATLRRLFDQRFGSLQQALADAVLPTRFFTKQTPRKKVTIKHLMPAAPDDTVVFSSPSDDYEIAWELEANGLPVRHDWQVRATYRAVAFATCVSADGTEYVEPLINPRWDRDGQLGVTPEPFEWHEEHDEDGERVFYDGKLVGLEQQLMLASAFCRQRDDWGSSALWGVGSSRE